MQNFTLEGLWCLENGMATRFQDIIIPRLASGLEPVPAYMLQEHPAKQFSANLAAKAAVGERAIVAGTNSYYEYIADWYTTTDGVCTITIVGTLTRYGMCTWGYEDIAGLLAAADRMESVKSVVLKIDSGGGAVSGLTIAADAIAAMKKPVVVWTNFAGSAAYFLASQATEIWVEDTTLEVCGSIGTLMVYTDQSQALKQAGLKVEIFRASESVDKARENGIEPLSDESRAKIQATLDACQQQFVGYVQRGRMGLLKNDTWRTAQMFGTADAIKIGLADVKGTLQGATKRAIQLAA